MHLVAKFNSEDILDFPITYNNLYITLLYVIVYLIYISNKSE